MGRWSVLDFLREQWTTLPLPTPEDAAAFQPKSVILVGANVGLGLEAAVHLAHLKPAQLLLTCRTAEKCEATKKGVEQRSRYDDESSPSVIESWRLELDSFQSVRAFADKFEAEGKTLDVLVANAAIFLPRYTKTQDDWETMLQVNYLSTALLSILMLPHLLRSSSETTPARLVTISSEAHYFTNIKKLIVPSDYENVLQMLNSEKYCTAAVIKDRYSLSKLLTIVFVRELTRRLRDPSRLSTCAVNPGFCYSEITRNTSTSFRAVISMGRALFARTTEMGSRTLVHAAVAPGEAERNGQYISSCKVAEAHGWLLTSAGKQWGERVWDETIELLGQVDPRINSIISEHFVDPRS